jgi:hypothetical protein
LALFLLPCFLTALHFVLEFTVKKSVACSIYPHLYGVAGFGSNLARKNDGGYVDEALKKPCAQARLFE